MSTAVFLARINWFVIKLLKLKITASWSILSVTLSSWSKTSLCFFPPVLTQNYFRSANEFIQDKYLIVQRKKKKKRHLQKNWRPKRPIKKIEKSDEDIFSPFRAFLSKQLFQNHFMFFNNRFQISARMDSIGLICLVS
jgi:type III secretory pathway component EscR